MMQVMAPDHRRPARTLASREQQLVAELLQLYRSGASILRIEETLLELRAVRAQLQRRPPTRRQ